MLVGMVGLIAVQTQLHTHSARSHRLLTCHPSGSHTCFREMQGSSRSPSLVHALAEVTHVHSPFLGTQCPEFSNLCKAARTRAMFPKQPSHSHGQSPTLSHGAQTLEDVGVPYIPSHVFHAPLRLQFQHNGDAVSIAPWNELYTGSRQTSIGMHAPAWYIA